MAFASGTNYTGALNPIDDGTPTKVQPPDLVNGFDPEAPVPAQEINWLYNRLCPQLSKFTAHGTWTNPTGAKFVRIVLVGGGGGGNNGGVGVGGAGGEAGEIHEMTFEASELPSSIVVTIGAGGANASTGGGWSYLTSGGFTLMCAAGGSSGNGTGPSGQPADVSVAALANTLGGAGGVGGAGVKGYHSRFGIGGARGLAGNPGSAGRGYGGGGGGGASSSGTSSGGGGGGGGYGNNLYGAVPSGSTGGAGAPGICLFFTTFDIV